MLLVVLWCVEIVLGDVSVGVVRVGTVDHGGSYPWAMVVLVACTRWWGGPPVDRMFLVGFARVTSEPGVLSLRCTTPAIGQVVKLCLWWDGL